MAVYDPKILQSDYYDHLGDMYLEKIVSRSESTRKGIFLTPAEVAQMMASMTIEKTDRQVNVLDPAVGSGRLLMAAHKQAPRARLFGVDIDLRSLRIAFTNLAIHSISGYLLHADSLRHEIDIAKEAGQQNWQYANHWYSCMDQLKVLDSGPNYNLSLNS
ncbi:MAG: N-6 DNA methylase [bacterium]